MRITRNNQSLNYKVYKDFRLKTLGFTEWLELHNLASKSQGATVDQLLKNLKAKFKWIDPTADKLGITSPPQLTDFEFPHADLKRKRIAEILQEGVTSATSSKVIKELEEGILYFNGNFDLVFRRRSEYALASTVQLIRIQNLIKINSEYAQEVYENLIFQIESRPDFVEAREIVEMNLDGLEDSTVTYTEVSSPFEDLSDIGSPGVVVYGYDGLPMHPPSPDYMSAPKEPKQAPPSPVYVPYVPEPVYPEFMPHEDDVLPAKEGDDDEDDDESSDDDEDDDDDVEEDEDEDEEENLSPADCVSPPAYHVTARMSIRPQTPIPFPSEEEVDILLAISTLPPSPLTPYSSPLP
ncbi:putative reverse transcriptase domain-containing protein [Tanacetum coccineum]|uniref:Reverse transcriptase domain-containing protein n=1 Tax=Tanacetum coccineum TaxID=301880 RepID=A0ABQ5GSJ9_9ASTR